MVFDKDGNGLVGHEEMKNTMRGLGINVGDKEIEAMIKKGDQDGDDHLNFSEFVKIMMEKQT